MKEWGIRRMRLFFYCISRLNLTDVNHFFFIDIFNSGITMR